MSAQPQDTGHWYKRDGSSCYTVNDRGVTLRDARKLSLVPSVTTVLQVVDKPALVNWKVQQAIMAALTMPRGEESEEAYIARIMADSKAQAIAAANEGTRIHDAIEQSFGPSNIPMQYLSHVEGTHQALREMFPDVNDWVSEKSFAHPLGYGGKVDLHSPSTGIVVDFKTKDGDFSDGKKLAYDQNIQLAAYQVGLELVEYATISSDSDQDDPILNRRCINRFHTCANIFVSRTHPGKVASHVWSADEIARGWRLFDKALALWKELKQYDGAF